MVGFGTSDYTKTPFFYTRKIATFCCRSIGCNCGTAPSSSSGSNHIHVTPMQNKNTDSSNSTMFRDESANTNNSMSSRELFISKINNIKTLLCEKVKNQKCDYHVYEIHRKLLDAFNNIAIVRSSFDNAIKKHTEDTFCWNLFAQHEFSYARELKERECFKETQKLIDDLLTLNDAYIAVIIELTEIKYASKKEHLFYANKVNFELTGKIFYNIALYNRDFLNFPVRSIDPQECLNEKLHLKCNVLKGDHEVVNVFIDEMYNNCINAFRNDLTVKGGTESFRDSYFRLATKFSEDDAALVLIGQALYDAIKSLDFSLHNKNITQREYNNLMTCVRLTNMHYMLYVGNNREELNPLTYMECMNYALPIEEAIQKVETYKD